MSKKSIRRAFRTAVFERDGYRCVKCGTQGKDRHEGGDLDAHHISPRDDMPNGGYVKENGISLCDDCHIKAEESSPEAGFRPEDLYESIGSSHEAAQVAYETLGR